MKLTKNLCVKKFPDWRQMDQQTLDDSYNNHKAIPESAAMFNDWIKRSNVFRSTHSQYLDISYGSLESEKIDYYSAGPNTPLVILNCCQFRSTTKESFSIVNHCSNMG